MHVMQKSCTVEFADSDALSSVPAENVFRLQQFFQPVLYRDPLEQPTVIQ